MNKNFLKVYIGRLIDNLEYLEILNPNLGFKKRKNIFGDQDIFDDIAQPFVEIVNNVEEADYILIPHNYFRLKSNKEYLDEYINLSLKFSKKIIIFAIGDSAEDIDIPNLIILRMSRYKKDKRDNEIIIPAYAADLSYGRELLYRDKVTTPIVGFCGWASVTGIIQRTVFVVKNLFLLHGPYRQGLYFRKKAIGMIRKSKIVIPNFIIRSFYSANQSTIKLDPRSAREEYRSNIINSDFILAPKGDGNYSVRFFETLSLGRIPVLIDTDCSLPLEDILDYSKFMIRVSYKDIKNIDNFIYDFYKNLKPDEWLNIQKEARKAFDQYLRIDVFFRYIFSYENPILSKY